MRWQNSPGGQALRQAQAAAGWARRTGCGIDEASDAVAHAGTRAEPARRAVLGGAGALAVATALPSSPKTAPRVVIVGSGIAGLGCAYRLWRSRGVRSEVYEYNASRAGGRIATLRGFFADGQYAEEHGEFISSEHTAIRQLSASLGLHLDNVNAYPPHTRAQDNRMRFGGRFWSQQALDRDWHEWGWQLFHEAAFRRAPWPTLHTSHGHWARRWDHMSAAEWIEGAIPGGLASDFGRLSVSALLDEYGGPVDEQSALNLIYLLGFYDSAPSGSQPAGAPQLSGTDEKWHVRGGNDQIVTRLVDRLPPGTVRLGERLVALRPRGSGYICTFASGHRVRDVPADHVVLALPFTMLREVDLDGLGIPAIQWQAIRREPLGSNAKVAMQFSARVWNAEHWTGTFYTDAMPQSGWETTIGQPGASGIMIALPGGHAGADLGRRYRLRSCEGQAPPAMVSDFLAVFEQNFPGCRAAYNGRAHYVWSSGDPHVGGAYSYLAAGQYTAFNGVQGRRHGNVHFAGEQTSVNFQGYMEGALRSGYRCAAEVL